jgi:hypothetical protein
VIAVMEVLTTADPGLFLCTLSEAEELAKETVLYQFSLILETILTGISMAESVMTVLMLKFFLKQAFFLVPLL